MSLVEIKPMLSIVMPMYGVEQYIEKAIRSVINQDFHDWELLVVNDGSLDKSRDIALSLALTDSRIRVIDKENGGLSDARNYGLNEAKGEYVHFFDSDDWIEKKFYSTLINEVADYDLLVCGYKVDNEYNVVERLGVNGELPGVIGNSLHHFVGTYLNFAWNKLFKRSFLLKNSLYYEKGLYRIEDAEFMMRFMTCAPKTKMIEYSGYHYMVRNTQTLSTIYDDNLIEHAVRSINIYSQLYAILCKNTEIIKPELGKMNINLIKSVFFRVRQNLSRFKITQYLQFINKVINNNDVCKYIQNYSPERTIDKLFMSAILNKSHGILLLMTLLKR